MKINTQLKPNGKRTNADALVKLYKGIDLFKDHWIGPTIQRTDSEGKDNTDYDRQMAALEREFQSHNIMREVINNWCDGLISEPFSISLRSSAGDIADDPQAEEALQDLTRWVSFVQSQMVQTDPCLSTFNTSSPWAEFVLSLGVIGRAAFRVWTPERYANDPDPIHRIHLHVLRDSAIAIEYDDFGFLEKVEYTYGKSTREVHEYIDGQYTITVENETTVIESGRWRIFALMAESLISESAIDKQNAICHELTMLIRNQQHAGFRRRTLFNAEAPPADVDMVVGPGIDEIQYGISYGEPGNEKIASPSLHESTPFPIDNFEKSVGMFRELLYTEFSQAHLLEASATISGESRVQQRQNFDVLLRGWSTRIEAALSHVFSVVLEELGYESLEAVVDLTITTGKLTGEERQQLRDDYGAGLLSQRTAIALGGQASDVDAEIEQIRIEREQSAAMMVSDFDENVPVGDNDDDDDNAPES